MNDKIEKTNLDIEAQRLNNPKTCVLTHNRFNTHLVLIFSELNKTENYKTLCRVSLNEEIEIVMSFKYLNVFKPKEHREDHHIRKPNDEIFLFEIGDKKYIYVGEKVITFETNDMILNNSLDSGFNDIRFPIAYGEGNIYFMLHQKYIPLEEYENSAEKNKYHCLYKKDRELKGDNIQNGGVVDYVKDSKNCKNTSDKNSN